MAARWTEREDATLVRLYQDGAAVREISAALGRSEDAINVRRRDLDIPARRTAWSQGEDDVLLASASAGLPAASVARQLGRSVSQVRWRRRRLGLTGPAAARYSAAEDAALQLAFVGDGNLEGLAERLGRTPDALRLRAAKLGLHEPARRRRWSASEDAVIRDGYESGLSCAQIARELPGRSMASVTARAAKLGLATHARRWSADDDERLRRLARGHRLDVIARRLGRTPDALRQRARKLRITLREGVAARAGARWTAEEDEFLRLHPALNPSTLSGLLDRSDRAITQRLAKLGLRTGRERSPHRRTPSTGRFTPGERIVLRRALEAGDRARLVRVARRLGLPESTVVPMSSVPAARRPQESASGARGGVATG